MLDTLKREIYPPVPQQRRKSILERELIEYSIDELAQRMMVLQTYIFVCGERSKREERGDKSNNHRQLNMKLCRLHGT